MGSAVASHWKPSTLLSENRASGESVHVCVFCALVGVRCVSVASRHWSECAAHCKPWDKRTEVPHAFANGCSALFKNPFTVSWRLTQSPSSQPHTPTNQYSGSAMLAPSQSHKGSLEYRHVWNSWYAHIQLGAHTAFVICMNFTPSYDSCANEMIFIATFCQQNWF